jgi:hypothetical protein
MLHLFATHSESKMIAITLASLGTSSRYKPAAATAFDRKPANEELIIAVWCIQL